MPSYWYLEESAKPYAHRRLRCIAKNSKGLVPRAVDFPENAQTILVDRGELIRCPLCESLARRNAA